MALRPGDEAPDFELPSHKDRYAKVRLSDFRGRKNVVVAFHPLAFTPICATQMQSYESDRQALEQRDAVALGISTDPQPSKAAWAQTLGTISFDLLSDFHPKGDVARKYGVMNEEAGFANRAVFVVDKQGRVAWSRVYGMDERPDVSEVIAALDTIRT
jgi:peroxiredoxin